MIVSDSHGYVFVELPRTGSTAVRRELRDHYDGRPILHKHATYEQYLRHASAEQRGYFAFSAIRNPMDSVVSRYYKLKTDHRGQFSRDEDGGHPGRLNRLLDHRLYAYLRRSNADFASYFMRYYWLPYDTWACLSHDRLDYILRFERLDDDFETVLRRIGIEPVRRLPVVNATTREDRGLGTHFTAPTHQRARRVFGPYMERWGYHFPDEWGLEPPSRAQRAQYQAFSRLAQLYWRYLRGRL
jgi:hypothetical protein